MNARRVCAIIITLTILISTISVAPVSASGGVVGTGTPASCTEAALVSALAGGGTITFNCGGAATITITSVMNVTLDATLEGGGIITLSGGLTSGIFHDLGAALTLVQITLQKAFNSSSDGSAIVGSGTLTLFQTTVEDSVNNGCGNVWMLGTPHISHSIFLSNTANSGGAVCTGSSAATQVSIVDSTFTGNSATNGGAIWLSPTTSATLTGDFLSDNVAVDGGGLYMAAGSSALLNADQFQTFFEANHASDDGGGVYNNGGTLTVNRATFYQNVVPPDQLLSGFGAGIDDRGPMTITEGYFFNNTGRWGGGLCVCDPTVPIQTSITRSTFMSNIANQWGGGLYANTVDVTVAITDTSFSNNSAANGGGIARFAAAMNLTNSSITGNNASAAAGGMWVDSGPQPSVGGYVEVKDTTIAKNTAAGNLGGGIYNVAEIDLINDTIADNTLGVYNFGTGGADAIMRMSNTVLHNPTTLNCDSSVGFAISSAGGNFADDTNCGLTGPHDQQGAGLDPKLGTFVSNDTRANTSYYLLQASSPLINAGVAGCPAVDQRHASRVGACDIGAIEFGGQLPWAFLPYIGK